MNRLLEGGLVSVTFRTLQPDEICRLVRQAGLRGIEWGGDVHAPPGDRPRAGTVRRLTEDAGLQTAAYGSYFRVIEADGTAPSFAPYLETAVALAAPTIRIWAGTRNPATGDDEYRERLAVRLIEVCDEAAAAGLRVALEFHSGTLTNTVESTLALLDRVSHPSLDTLWQPSVGMSADECEAGLKLCLPRTSNVHVFHWHPGYERHPLATGAEAWRRYLQVLRNAERPRFLLLEFVSRDEPAQFLADARTLSGWLAEA
jgi:sugar phosphate isomerase/epimerase